MGSSSLSSASEEGMKPKPTEERCAGARERGRLFFDRLMDGCLVID